MSGGTMQERLEALKQLLQMFKVERMVYLGMTVAALVILLTCAVILLVKELPNAAVVGTGLFGSSGLITFTTGRLLRMWQQAFTAILGIMEDRSHGAP
jgi:hypothetical protein